MAHERPAGRRKAERIMKTAAIVIGLAFAILGVFSLAAQAPAQPTPRTTSAFGEVVDVELINVEVWVSDRRGNPVTGLGVDDFEIREDGELVQISNFAEIRSSPLTDPFAPGDPVEAPVEVARDHRLELADLLAEPDIAGGMGFLVLYIDELFSKPSGRKQLLEDLRTFVELRRVPHQRVLILRQDKGLRVEANLGSSRGELEAALDRLEQPSSRGAQTWAEERNALNNLMQLWESEAVIRTRGDGDACDRFAVVAFNQIQVHINLSRARIAETIEELMEAARLLAGLPGPKTMIYVSDGLALTPGSDLLSLVRHLCPGRQDDRRMDYMEGMGEAFRRLSRHANANRVTIYTLQAQGLGQHLSATTAEQRGVARTTRALSRYNSESRILHRQGMGYLADETGGRAVFNRGRFIEDLEMIAEDMTGYYSLAYAPPHGGDGLEHRIQVELKGEKLRVRHRPGYRDKSRDQRMFERLQSALRLNLMANPLEISLGAGEITAAEKKRFNLPLHVRIPVDKITFLPQAGGDFATLRVLVQTRAERDGKTALKQETYRLSRPAGTNSETTVSLVLDLDLEAGIHVIAFGVRDETTQETSFVATAVEIQSPADEAS